MADYTIVTPPNEHTGMQDSDRRTVQTCTAADRSVVASPPCAVYGLFKM